jgi:hypothetical protein
VLTRHSFVGCKYFKVVSQDQDRSEHVKFKSCYFDFVLQDRDSSLQGKDLCYVNCFDVGVSDYFVDGICEIGDSVFICHSDTVQTKCIMNFVEEFIDVHVLVPRVRVSTNVMVPKDCGSK